MCTNNELNDGVVILLRVLSLFQFPHFNVFSSCLLLRIWYSFPFIFVYSFTFSSTIRLCTHIVQIEMDKSTYFAFWFKSYSVRFLCCFLVIYSYSVLPYFFYFFFHYVCIFTAFFFIHAPLHPIRSPTFLLSWIINDWTPRNNAYTVEMWASHSYNNESVFISSGNEIIVIAFV